MEKTFQILNEKCISGIIANNEVCRKNLENSTATITALIPEIGYEKASEIIKIARAENKSVKEAALLSGFIAEEKFEILTFTEVVCRLGR